VISGVATSAGVESTARHAHELGFNVTLAIDAMTAEIKSFLKNTREKGSA
jgi:nicotinamidase-related amidase